MRTVLLTANDNPLLLSEVQRDQQGNVISGNVVNGLWRLKIVNGFFYVYSSFGGQRLSKIAAPLYSERLVPDDVLGDYNAVIAWAETP